MKSSRMDSKPITVASHRKSGSEDSPSEPFSSCFVYSLLEEVQEAFDNVR